MMILEHALLNVIAGRELEFEAAFAQAREHIAATPGFVALEHVRGVENPSWYLLLVRWRSIEDHTVGFRESTRYQQWRRLLHRFYDPFPTVHHFEETDLGV